MSPVYEKGPLWSPRVQVRQTPKRGRYTPEALYPVLDEAYHCHVGFSVDEQPFVMPMVFGRDGDRLFLHGSGGARALKTLRDGARLCVSVLNLHAVVLARSALNQSVNYDSAVVLGAGREVHDVDGKLAALECILEHVVPGRWSQVRPPSEKELKGTRIIEVAIEEASVKSRDTPPYEEPGDEQLPFWGGLLPVVTTIGVPIPDVHVPDGTELPEHLQPYGRRVGGTR